MKASITDLGRPVLYSLLASVLLVAGTLVFAALAATSAIEGSPGLTAVLTLPPLASLLLAARNLHRGTFGSAVAWGYTALPFELVLLLLALPLVRPSIILGADACTPGLVPTPVADPCSSQPMQFWLPLLLFAAASVMTLAAVRAGKHRARVTGSAEQSKPG